MTPEPRNCADCKHFLDQGWEAGPYANVCTNPKLSTVSSTNQWVRCNETREFNFACGTTATWFEPNE